MGSEENVQDERGDDCEANQGAAGEVSDHGGMRLASLALAGAGNRIEMEEQKKQVARDRLRGQRARACLKRMREARKCSTGNKFERKTAA